MKQTLMGNDAIAWGLIHANVDMVSGYPGTPSSEILGNVQKYARYHFEERWDENTNLYIDARKDNIEFLEVVLKRHKETNNITKKSQSFY